MIEYFLISLVFILGPAVDAAIGGGGGFFIVPALILLKVEPIVAVASMLVAFSGALIGGLIKLRKSEYFHFDKNHTSYILLAAVGGIIGVFVALDLDPGALKKIIALLLFVMLILWLLPKREKSLSLPFPKLIIPIAFFCTGIYFSVVGSGVAFLITFLFLFLTQKGLKDVLASRLITGLFLILVIAPFYIWNGKVDFTITVIGFFSALAGGYVGVHYFVKIPEKILRIVFTVVTLVSIGMMFFV